MEAEHPQLGELIGAYRLEAELGRGGMGRVYRASHHLLGRPAAVKVLAPALAADSEFVSRFFYEARVVNDIRNPNIIDIVDFIAIESPRRVAYVMEVLEGVSLGALLKNDRLSVRQAINATLQLASALEAVHRLNVIHRDLKPDNIFVIQPLDSDLSVVPSVKILDFGIAKTLDANPSHHTTTGAVLGTPAYMSPEQIDGAAIGPPADIYALGEIFYEMITGQRLFSGSNTAIFTAKVAGDAPPLSLPDDLPQRKQIRALIERSIAVDPKARPGLGEVKARLQELLAAEPAHAPRPSGPPTAPAPRSISARPLNTLDGRTLPPISTGVRSSKMPLWILSGAIGVLSAALLLSLRSKEPEPPAVVPPPPIEAPVPVSVPVKPTPPTNTATATAPLEIKRATAKPESKAKSRTRNRPNSAAPLKRDETTEW